MQPERSITLIFAIFLVLVVLIGSLRGLQLWHERESILADAQGDLDRLALLYATLDHHALLAGGAGELLLHAGPEIVLEPRHRLWLLDAAGHPLQHPPDLRQPPAAGDGTWLQSRQPVRDADLTRIAATPTAALLDGWRRSVFLWVLALTVVSVMLATGFVVHRHSIRRQQAADARYRQRLLDLVQAGSQIGRGRSLDGVFERAARLARQLIPAHQAVASATRNAGGAQEIHAISLSDDYAAWRDYDERPDGSGIYRRVIEQGEPMRLTQPALEAHPDFTGFGAAAKRHPPLRGWLAAPVKAGDGRALGLLQLSHREHGEFDAEDEAILQQLASVTAAAVEPGQYVMVAVTDSGEGMSPDVASRAFEPFFTTKDVGTGTGLGLSMVYGFLRQSGGQAKIYSEPGEGTVVRLYLPRHLDPSGRPAAPVSDDRPSRLRGTERILLVEDDELVRTFITRSLVDLGYAVVSAADGPSALEIVGTGQRFALLLTDVVLPSGMSGRQVAEAIRQRLPGIRVLFASGYSDNAIVHQGRLDPDVAFLGKPFSRNQLAAKVRRILDG